MISDTSCDGQNAQRNFRITESDGETEITIVSKAFVWLPGDLEASTEPRETTINQDIAHRLIALAHQLLRAPHAQRLL